MNERKKLKKRIDELSPSAVRFVARMVDSLSSPPKASIPQEATWITGSPDWVEYFGLSLSVHHGGTADPLGLTGFETVFENACESVDWTVEKPESATRRFIDLTVHRSDGKEKKLSLKSTAANRISESTAHISKLTEAAWIQDVRAARDRRNHTLALFRCYTAAVDSIVMLRAFRKSREMPSRYQLLEIPTGIFDSLQRIPVSAFNADGPTLDCSFGEHEVAARVSLDRSDAKITVKQILLAACTVHAEWELVSPRELGEGVSKETPC